MILRVRRARPGVPVTSRFRPPQISPFATARPSGRPPTLAGVEVHPHDATLRHSHGRISPPAILLIVAVSNATVAQGAFYPHQFRVLLVLLAVALGLSAVLQRRRCRLSWHPFTTMLAGLGAVAVLSGWAADGVAEALPTLGLVGAVTAAFIVAGRSGAEEREALVTAVIVVGFLVAVSGIAGVVLRREPLALVDEGLWRAASTLTYSNATAGFLLLPVALALGRAAAGPRSKRWSLASFVFVVAIATTLSRGGVLGLATVLVVLVVLGRGRTVMTETLTILGGAGCALAGIMPTMPAHLPGRPLLAAGGLVVGAALVAFAPRRLGLVPALATFLVAGIIGLGAASSDFLADIATVRGTAASPARLDGWASAVDVFAARPVLGAGPGSATYSYVTDAGEPLVTRFVHNEYLQLLAEMGALGAAVALAGLVATFRALVRLPHDHRHSSWLGGVAGLAGLLLHSGLDFLWHIPVVPVTAAIVVAIVSDRPPRVGTPGAVAGERRNFSSGRDLEPLETPSQSTGCRTEEDLCDD